MITVNYDRNLLIMHMWENPRPSKKELKLYTYLQTLFACSQQQKSEKTCGFLFSSFFVFKRMSHIRLNSLISRCFLPITAEIYVRTFVSLWARETCKKYIFMFRVEPPLTSWAGHVNGCFRPSCDCLFAAFCVQWQSQSPFFFETSLLWSSRPGGRALHSGKLPWGCTGRRLTVSTLWSVHKHKVPQA